MLGYSPPPCMYTLRQSPGPALLPCEQPQEGPLDLLPAGEGGPAVPTVLDHVLELQGRLLPHTAWGQGYIFNSDIPIPPPSLFFQENYSLLLELLLSTFSLLLFNDMETFPPHPLPMPLIHSSCLRLPGCRSLCW